MSQALGNSSEQNRKKPCTHLPYKPVGRGSQAAYSISRISDKLGRNVRVRERLQFQVWSPGKTSLENCVIWMKTWRKCRRELYRYLQDCSKKKERKNVLDKGIASTWLWGGGVAGPPTGQQDQWDPLWNGRVVAFPLNEMGSCGELGTEEGQVWPGFQKDPALYFVGSRVACSQVLRTRGKQEDLFGSCYSNAEGDGAVPEEAGGDATGLPMPLEEEMAEVMQGFVVGLEGCGWVKSREKEQWREEVWAHRPAVAVSYTQQRERSAVLVKGLLLPIYYEIAELIRLLAPL